MDIGGMPGAGRRLLLDIGGEPGWWEALSRYRRDAGCREAVGGYEQSAAFQLPYWAWIRVSRQALFRPSSFPQ